MKKNNETILKKLKAIESHISQLNDNDDIFFNWFDNGVYLSLDYDFNEDSLLYSLNEKIHKESIIYIHYKRNHYESNKNKILRIIKDEICYLETGTCYNIDNLEYYYNKYSSYSLDNITTSNDLGKRKANALNKFINYWDGNQQQKLYKHDYNGYGYKEKPILKMIKNFSEDIKILEENNDAPKGGKNGDYVVVEYSIILMDLMMSIIDDFQENFPIINVRNIKQNEAIKKNYLICRNLNYIEKLLK